MTQNMIATAPSPLMRLVRDVVRQLSANLDRADTFIDHDGIFINTGKITSEDGNFMVAVMVIDLDKTPEPEHGTWTAQWVPTEFP